jgi:hypothetical protein
MRRGGKGVVKGRKMVGKMSRVFRQHRGEPATVISGRLGKSLHKDVLRSLTSQESLIYDRRRLFPLCPIGEGREDVEGVVGRTNGEFT